MVQALVQQRTLSKIRVFGSDAQLWPEEVRSKVEEYGSQVNRGGQVPRELFLENGNLYECLEDGEIGDIIGHLENGAVFFS